jgi:hypothetical protein
VRTEGRRVYVDLTWPLEDEKDPRTPRSPANRDSGFSVRDSGVQDSGARDSAARDSASGNRQEKAGTADQEQQYRTEIEPIHRRIAEIRPFILSAAQSGSTDVYAALDSTLAALEASLVGMRVPAPEVGQHQLLIAATRSARSGLEPGFSGDRLAHAQKALTMFDGAMAVPVISTAP